VRGFKEGEAEVKKEAEGKGLNAKRKGGREACQRQSRGCLGRRPSLCKEEGRAQ
jgi:hypothetical protein